MAREHGIHLGRTHSIKNQPAWPSLRSEPISVSPASRKSRFLTTSKQNASNLQLHETSPQPQGSTAALRSLFPGKRPRETKATAGPRRNSELGGEAAAELLFGSRGVGGKGTRRKFRKQPENVALGEELALIPQAARLPGWVLMVVRLEKVWWGKYGGILSR